MKVAASTRLPRDLYKRVERLAQHDHRNIANVIEICVHGHVPKLEREILGEQFASAPPDPVAEKEVGV